MRTRPCSRSTACPTLYLSGAILALHLTLIRVALGASFAVDSTGDTADLLAGDGVCSDTGGFCSLRAAVQETNALAGHDTITLPGATYTLTISGAAEDAAASGDLDITDPLTITASSPAVIDGNALDRVLHVIGSGSLVLQGLEIRNGDAADYLGGGVLAEAFTTLTISNSTITANSSHGNPGGGGGVFCYAAVCSLSNSTISDNTAPNFGGGLAGFFASVEITNCTVSGNSVTGANGGGISLGGGSATITGSTINSNTSAGEGGGIDSDGTLTVRNSTLSGNTAGDDGGGLRAVAATISNSTITANQSGGDGDGGGVFALGAIELRNTLIAGNFDSGGEAPDCGGAEMLSLGYNLIGSSTGCSLGGDATGNLIDVVAPMSTLADHGGATHTHALLPGNPAVSAGNPATPGSGGNACEATDQRGTGRPQGARCDIGAYELVDGLCGNYFVEAGEQCDAGANNSDDFCCSESCQTQTTCDDGLACNGSDTCDVDGACSLHSGSPCDDMDSCTQDSCVEPGTCSSTVVAETPTCGTCADEVDNDENGDVDADDSACATLAESQHFAVLGRSLTGKSVSLGGYVGVDIIEGDIPSSTAPFPLGPSRGGVCGEAKLEILSGVQIAGPLAAAANQRIVFGGGGDTNIAGGFVDAPSTIRILTGVAPVVGPGTCSGDLMACTLDADCAAPASTCEGSLLTDLGNPYVDHSGTHEEYLRCAAAKAALLADTAYAFGLPGLMLPPIAHKAGDPQPLPSLTGAGVHVVRTDKLRVAGSASLIITADDSAAIVIIQVAKGLSIGKEASVQVGGQLKPENVLWVTPGRGTVKVLGSATFVGTVLGPERTIKIGQNTIVEGALLGSKVKINGTSTIVHRPFTPLL